MDFRSVLLCACTSVSVYLCLCFRASDMGTETHKRARERRYRPDIRLLRLCGSKRDYGNATKKTLKYTKKASRRCFSLLVLLQNEKYLYTLPYNIARKRLTDSPRVSSNSVLPKEPITHLAL